MSHQTSGSRVTHQFISLWFGPKILEQDWRKCYLFNIIRQKLNKDKKSELCWGGDAVERKQAGRGRQDGSLTFTDRIYIGSKIGRIPLPLEKAKKNPNHSVCLHSLHIGSTYLAYFWILQVFQIHLDDFLFW